MKLSREYIPPHDHPAEARLSAGMPICTSRSRKRFILRNGSSVQRTPAKIIYALRWRYAVYDRSSASSCSPGATRISALL